MIVRQIDSAGDWMFGSGRNSYMSNADAVAQCLATRLRSFLGDCFFDIQAGVDWFNLLGSKNQLILNLAVRSVIIGTQGVASIINATLVLRSNRDLHLEYEVATLYGPIVRNGIGLLLTESGDILTTEDGDQIHG